MPTCNNISPISQWDILEPQCQQRAGHQGPHAAIAPTAQAAINTAVARLEWHNEAEPDTVLCQWCEVEVEETAQVWHLGRNQQWCEDCTENDSWNCDSCGDTYSTDSGSHETGWSHYCEDCFTNNGFYYCGQCGEVSRDDIGCQQCRDNGIIHDYSYKPDAIFHRTAENPVGQFAHYGIEIEVEASREGWSPEEIATSFIETMGGESEFYAKHDSSLDNGVELVSHPRTLASWQELGDTLSAGLEKLHLNSARAWNRDTTGLHVHADRRAFTSRSHLGRFAYLISANRAGMVRFCGRDAEYASFTNMKAHPGAVKKATGRGWSNHSDAVNFSPAHTVEVRTFRPSLAGGRIVAAVELVDAMITYTRNLTSADALTGAMHWDTFSAWLTVQADYTNAAHIMNGGRFQPATTLNNTKRSN